MRIVSLAAAAMLCLAAVAARAGETADNDFHVDLTSYLWATSFNGNIGAGPVSAPVSAGFIDILDNSDSLVGIEGRLGVRKGRFGAYVDGLWNRVGFDTVNGPFGSRIAPTMTLTYVEGALFYRLIDLPPDRSPDKQDFWGFGVAADAYAGARYTDLGLELDFKRINQTESWNKSWVDPIVGARVDLAITDNWRFLLDNNVGGFGAGSKFSYSGMALVGYQFTVWGMPSTVWAGYKGLYQNYQDGDFKWDMWVHGPIVGSTIRFF
ncbi:MAG: hypothetical protein U1E53_24135 [Dongiaceae bacterium]